MSVKNSFGDEIGFFIISFYRNEKDVTCAAVSVQLLLVASGSLDNSVRGTSS